MKGYFSQHAVKAIIGARFFPGARTLAYAAAGATHYKVVRFMAVLTGVTLAQTLLYLYATDLIGEQVLSYLEDPAMRWTAAGIILFVIISGHFIITRSRKMKARL